MRLQASNPYRHATIPDYADLASFREAALAEVSKVIIGQEEAVEMMLVAAIARGHVLVEGPPGTAKTLLGHAIAHVLGATFTRVQFTPDTTPSELIGTTYERGKGETREVIFQPGLMFTNVLLADEINRTPPRTQAALLEGMQERTVTVDGRRHHLPDPFLVIATQNPYEQHGVFPLPEAQLDRFLFKVVLGYADEAHEVEVLKLPHLGVTPDMLGEVRPQLGPVGIVEARDEIDSTKAPDDVLQAIVTVVRSTREQPGVFLGASSRAGIHLLAATKARARFAGRDTVVVQDVRDVTPYVLSHRILLDEGADATVEGVLQTALAKIA